MKNKKILSMVIAAAVMLSTTSTVFASSKDKPLNAAEETKPVVFAAQEQQAKITKDEAKKIAKDMLKEYLGYEVDESKLQARIEFRPSYYNTKDDYIWDINWNFEDALKSTNVRASVNSTSGKVISMSKYIYSKFEPQPSVPSITQQKAQEAANAFVNRVFPNDKSELKLADDSMARLYGGYQSVNYSFNYQRYKNGILLEGDYVRVDVDGVNGSVISFESKLTENLQLPSTDGLISKDSAEELFRKNTEMGLLYLPYRNKYQYESQPNSIKLVYNPNDNSYNMIDAKNGALINNLNPSSSQTEIKDLTPSEKAAWLSKAAEVKTQASEINSARAEIVMQEKLKELYGETYKLDYLSYEESKDNYDTNGRKAWRSNFYKEESGKRSQEGGSITIDALTEGILSVSRYDGSYNYDEAFTPKLTWSEAYNKALDSIAKYYPDKIKEIKTEQRNMIYKQIVNEKEIPQREYIFNFQRLSNNIPYANNNLTVVFDAKTGMLRELRCMWSDKITFPSASGVMSSTDAENIFFKKYKPELTYALMQPNQYKLVYRLKPSNEAYMGQYIDAFNGKMVNYDGQEISEQSGEFLNKIKGHKFEKELTILATQGVLDTNNFELDKPVTKMDFIKILVDAKGYRPYLLKEAASLKYSNVSAGDANYSYLQMAVFYGILENKEGEFDFNQTIARGEMAKALVKLIGYEKLAKATDVFVLPVADRAEIKEEDIGYMAIAKALGILEVENSKLRPSSNATMVELAAAIYKVLGTLRSGLY